MRGSGLALEVLDRMIQETANAANRAAENQPDFEKLGLGHGVGLRLRTLLEAKGEIVATALREHETEERSRPEWLDRLMDPR